MKPETKLFILPTCPYCKQVLNWMEELKSEDTKYAGVDLTIVNEKLQPELAEQYDYYYVPTFFSGDTKVHEGACSKEAVRKIFDEILAKVQA